ncbi:hypothetical protein LTR84_012937 [Exophiala bonariae]|uniref:Nitronate monooxygenase domain-containing protein n=1 Tax=Exophiala bonariae TaxID=1690606 RepID=A0AAV9NDJ7_9EURO|nr:hypothetical protein LTR84_012937 [Exophiala bonariae]
MPRTLKEQLPWTQSPIIANAPMGGFAGGALAAAVTAAGGLGQIGAVVDMGELERELTLAQKSLPRSKSNGDTSNNNTISCSSTTLPIGVGLLTFILKLESVLPLLQRFQPSVIWLFAASELNDYTTWTRSLHAALPHSSIWIQVGSASAALTVARGDASDASTQPDALVLQGSDAGGHGFEHSASIVSLVPETLDLLAAHGLSALPVLAAGGIADARGAAAAFALGAAGVVLGTRFLAARETIVPHEAYRDAVLSAKDGSTSTVRSKVFDNVKGPNIWPGEYDGRSLVTRSYTDFVDGVDIGVVRERHADAAKRADAGFADTTDGEAKSSGNGAGRRANVWAGASVGLVNELQDAGDVVREVRKGVDEALKAARARL